MKKVNLILLLVLMFACLSGFAQISLNQKLAGKRNLTEIMQIVKTHFAAQENNEVNNNENEEGEKEIYHWYRWAKQNEHRVDANGNLYLNPDSLIKAGWENYKTGTPFLNNTDNPASNTSSWISLGPDMVSGTAASNSDGLGRVNCIAFHPTNANTMLIGTPQGGIWKTTNGGGLWFTINDDLANMGIGGVCYDRTNPNIILALTGDGDGVYGIGGNVLQHSSGILKSYDGGANWINVKNFGTGSGQSGIFGFKLIQHPYLPGNFYAATSDGIYQSTDFGNTWVIRIFGDFRDIEVKPDGVGADIYATRFGSLNNYFYTSSNYGANWSKITIAAITGAVRCAIAVTPNNSNVVYLLAGRDVAGQPPGTPLPTTYKGVFKSTNSGQSFTQVCTTPNILNGSATGGAALADQSSFSLGLEVSPLDEQVVNTGCYHIWRSVNGNTNPMTFTRATWWGNNTSGEQYVHADIHNLAYNPLNNFLYACHDGGVSVSTDHGVTWATISNYLHITAGVYGDWLESDPSVICAGTQDNGTVYRYIPTNNYKTIGGGDGGDVLINQTNQNDIIYAATGNIFRTSNPGANETGITPVSVTWLNNFYPNLARNYNDDNNIYAGGANRLYRSTNRGTNWDSSSAAINCTTLLTTCRSNTNRIYTGNTGALYRSNDFGVTLTQINTNPGFTTSMPITDVEATHANSAVIYVCLGGYNATQKVFYSNDAGANWTNVTGSLPNVACHSIILDAANNVYVGTDIGVFVRPAGQNDWRPYFNGLARTPVMDLMVNQTFNRLIAITFGHGNYSTDLYTNTCPSNLSIGTVSGNKFFEANNITANATVFGGAGTNVAVSGAAEVILLDGFTVTEQNNFRAYNAPCGTVGVPLIIVNNTDPMPLENIVFKAGNNKPFPNGHINYFPDGTCKIYFEDAGNYLIRITDSMGNVAAPVIEKQITAAGSQTLEPAQFNLPEGMYYIQLFKNKELIHFLEWHKSQQSH